MELLLIWSLRGRCVGLVSLAIPLDHFGAFFQVDAESMANNGGRHKETADQRNRWSGSTCRVPSSVISLPMVRLR
ncbi:uncharacterized protein B0T15DRAFT_538484 [Chaetomium strumarium]|uniref:Secreted protein n=1 Tax=Chaetomium strumarium TaxID=1170767 RepID=A0AAJ0GMY4_9PEZI|nr:hypothetical protein B0T15DRAFT_538484 [Chaetomium strumarium]